MEGTQAFLLHRYSNYIKRVLPQLEAGKSEGYIGWDLAQLAGDNNPELEEDLLGIYEHSEIPAVGTKKASRR